MRLQNADLAAEFAGAFEAAQNFNAAAKAGEDGDLVWADEVEDAAEVADGDVDNKPADGDAE